MPAVASAQDAGYAPPPMFEDNAPVMGRPQAEGGYIIPQKVSPNTVLPESTNRPRATPMVLPRVSVDPDASRPARTSVAPQVSAPRVAPAGDVEQPSPTPPETAPAAPDIPAKPVEPAKVETPVKPAVQQAATPTAAPVEKPQMMKPIVEEVYIKRDKPAAAPNAVKAPTPPKKPAAPRAEDERTAAPQTDKTASQPKTEPVKKTEPVEKKQAQTPPVVPVPETATVPRPAVDSKTDAPVYQSSITGPKTMPALPTTSVEASPTFVPSENADEPTIFERQQKATVPEDSLKPIVPRPKDGVAPADFAPGEQGALKRSVPLEPGQISLAADVADSLAAGAVNELNAPDRQNWRVQIRSFATAHGSGLASDRRIALGRALSLRSTLITQGVPAAKIDVRVEGMEDNQSSASKDRIDLYLYGPKEE